MKDLHELLTTIQAEIGGDEPCRVIADLGSEGDLRLTAAWTNSDWQFPQMFTKLQIENSRNSSALMDLFVVLVKESEEYKSRQEGAG